MKKSSTDSLKFIPAKFIPALLTIFLFLFFWSVICKLGIISAYVLPSPEKCFNSLVVMIISGDIFIDIGISFSRVARGFLLALVIAFALGMISSVVPFSKHFFEYLIQFFKNVPPISMIPLLILWCGIGETTKLIIIILASFFPMYMNIVKGFTGCDKKLIEVGKSFGYTRLRCFFKIILPNAISDILVGMRIGLGYAWRAIIGAEMVAASTGLGHMILFSQTMSRTDRVIVGIVVIGLVGYFTDKSFGIVLSKVLKGKAENGWN